MRDTRPRALALAALLLILLASRVSAQQLAGDVLPDQYELRFALNLQDDTFAGSEQILVNIVKPTTRITLNAVGISFKQVTIVSGFSSQPATVSVDEAHQTATFTVKRRLLDGPARIHIEYTAKLLGALRGLYVGRAGGRKYVASQFEATDARRAFPCFDQPDMKASFLVTAVVPAGSAAISNGRVISDTPGPGSDEHTVKFATTRKMSTYLLALAAGDFDCLQGESDGVPIRVCAIRGKTGQGRFALDAAQSFLHFYDDYFAIKYPFGKLDLVAIPDFAGGGMENTGAIFFGEHDLLVDPRSAPVEAQKLVATTIAHEIAHEWIGDLVTMKWWNDLWLKEGFATFFETRPIEAWKPEWHAELDEVASAENAMIADALDTTRAAQAAVSTPQEIEASYDEIAYQKAGAVLRMVEATMGREAFRTALGAFIRKFAYGNATGADFWAAMAENSVRGPDQVLRTFLDQPGVPIVSVASRCTTDATSSLTLAQQRFRIEPARESAPASPLWTIPVMTRPVAPRPGVPTAVSTRLLASAEQTFDQAGCNDVVLGNGEGSGYYRTAYPRETLGALGKNAETVLTGVERLRLLDDQWALARAGRLDIGDYLSLLATYSTERAPAIVEALGTTLARISDDLATDANRATFEAWIRDLMAARAGELEQPPADDTDGSRGELRAQVLWLLGRTGRDPNVLGRARAATTIGTDGNSVSERPVLDVIARLAAASGDQAVFDRLTANIEHADSPDLYLRSVTALGDFTDPVLVRRALEYALSDRVQGHDTIAVVRRALENGPARATAWPFVKSHWKDLVTKAGAEETLDGVLKGAATFCDAGLRDDTTAFFDARATGAERPVRQTLSLIQACVAFKTAQRGNFEKWLKNSESRIQNSEGLTRSEFGIPASVAPTPPRSRPRSIATGDRRRRGSRSAATRQSRPPSTGGPR